MTSVFSRAYALLLSTLLMLSLVSGTSYAGDDHDHTPNNGHSDDHNDEQNDEDHDQPHSEDHASEEDHAADEDHNDQHGHGHEEDHDSTQIGTDAAARAGITTATAGPGRIEYHTRLYGRLITPAAGEAQAGARFPGMVRELRVSPGDKVIRGQILAMVESNESLQNYAVKAPIDGVVVQQFASTGELTSGPLFRVQNNSQLWADLQVFSNARNNVRAGMPVHIVHQGHKHDSVIRHLLPAASGEPFMLARVVLDNPSHNNQYDLQPGDFISAEVDSHTVDATVMVDNRALQEYEGQMVVYVQQGERYQTRPVTLGSRDDHHSEVLAGLNAGEQYVVANSYLIKADIGKSGAAHEH